MSLAKAFKQDYVAFSQRWSYQEALRALTRLKAVEGKQAASALVDDFVLNLHSAAVPRLGETALQKHARLSIGMLLEDPTRKWFSWDQLWEDADC